MGAKVLGVGHGCRDQGGKAMSHIWVDTGTGKKSRTALCRVEFKTPRDRIVKGVLVGKGWHRASPFPVITRGFSVLVGTLDLIKEVEWDLIQPSAKERKCDSS